jgi:hypothetical protein|tara:strand:- start:4457 stop:4645 length:189 start_codon:yes stop_codon:yes gene_type:complete
MTVVERMAAALEAAKELLKMVATYHRDEVLLESAPDHPKNEFADAFCATRSTTGEGRQASTA